MGELIRVSFGALGRHQGEVGLAQAPTRSKRSREAERLYQLIWSEAPGIGWQRLKGLENAFGSLEQAWRASGEELEQALAGHTRLSCGAIRKLEEYRQRLGAAPLDPIPSAAQRQRWRRKRCLLPGDAALPPALLKLERPPLQLFWQGRGSLWGALRKRKAVAVVGTRKPSRHGETMARALGQALAEAGWPVVSGLAEGIDAAAHRGCLEAGGRPIGVLGTPLERVYPRHHGSLQQRVADAGLLVSEQPAGTAIRAAHFALRNRLQVALVEAVVLVECPRQSGALHSANQAWSEGIPLWVVPGDASRVSAAGSNAWLSKGASILLDPADLIRSLGTGPLRQAPERSQGNSAVLQRREAALLAALGPGASLEQLCERLRQGPAALSERLLSLELEGVVRSEPGLWWRPC